MKAKKKKIACVYVKTWKEQYDVHRCRFCQHEIIHRASDFSDWRDYHNCDAFFDDLCPECLKNKNKQYLMTKAESAVQAFEDMQEEGLL